MRERLGPIFQVIKTAIAAGLAWVIAQQVLHIPLPFFAPLSVILVIQATIADTVQRAVNRLIAVVAGVVVSVLILQWLHLSALTITLTLLVSMLIPTLLRINPLIIMQIGVTAVMVVVMHGTGLFAVERIVETIVGALVAIVVNALVIPPNLDPAAEKRVRELTDLLGADLQAVSREPKEQSHKEIQARGQEITGRLSAARDALRAARQSIKYNPFLGGRGVRLGHLERAMPQLEHMAVQVGGILHGLGDIGTAGHPAIDGLNDALWAAGECISTFGRALVDHSAESRAALEKALDEARDSQCHSLSQLKQLGPLAAVRENGAILTDLNRIMTEIGEAMPAAAGPSERGTQGVEAPVGEGPVVRT
ncbi:MAG: hypothetical protein JWN15_2271 [Firmicutes bacterium]|nr:hypothetical protein [Bacillota bacterium]